MKRLSITLSLICTITLSLLSQTAADACTSIMVGRGASADGSVMTSHTCDSWYRTWLVPQPAADFPSDTTMAIYRGRMHTASPSDITGTETAGTIPQASHTFRYLDTAYPSINEHQLAMGETTYSGRDTMVNTKGMFMIEELQRVALQRCKTAREAISLMGDLIKRYGYGDSGEALTIADPREVWLFEVQGEGPDKIGGVWAAARIPDDHIAVSANISRIGKIDFNDPDRFMTSGNLTEVALRMGLWDGKEEFSFWKAFSGGNYLKEPKNYSVRELYIMQQLAPSALLNDSMEELPLSIKPERKLTVDDVSDLLASYYEGTDLNLSARLKVKNPAKKGKQKNDPQLPDSVVSDRANPWMRPDEIAIYEALGDSAMHNIRTVSVSWCAYSTVIQCRSWLPDAVGGVVWVALDNPGQSPRFPIFAGNTAVPSLLRVCGQHSRRDDSALWHFREPNRLATVRWGKARKIMEPARKHFQEKGSLELPLIESEYVRLSNQGETQKATDLLNNYSADFFGATIHRWDEINNQLWYDNWKGF